MTLKIDSLFIEEIYEINANMYDSEVCSYSRHSTSEKKERKNDSTQMTGFSQKFSL